MDKLQIYEATVDPNIDSDLEVSYIGLVDMPAIEKDFQAFNENKSKMHFAVNDELQIISGPAMVADLPMFRNDDAMGEYYVKFTAPTIQTIVEKFSAKGLMNNFNLFHDENQKVGGVTIFNSFVTSKKLGISAPKGFEDLAEGSWFISVKINNPAVWASVKAGVVKGFSVEGIFEYIPGKFTQTPEQMAVKKLFELLGDDVKQKLINALNDTHTN